MFRLEQPVRVDELEAWELTESSQSRVELHATEDPAVLLLKNGCREGHAFVLLTSQGTSRPLLVRSCPVQEALPVLLEPTAELSGTLPAGTDLTSGQIHLVRCGTEFRFGMLPAWIEAGRLTAAVPEGCWDLTLRLGTKTPITWPQLHFAAGASVELGRIALREGAALLTRVVRGDGIPVAGAVVEAFPADDFRQVAEQTFGSDLRDVGFPGRSDADGWVRLAGLPEGPLRLRARSEKPDLAPVFYGPFELEPNEEVRFEDVVLPAASEITLGLEAVDGVLAHCDFRLAGHLDPGCGWLNRTLLEAEFREDGTAGPFSLAPGDWRFSVTCHEPRGTAFGVARAAFSVSSGSQETVWLPVAGQLFHGRVLRGDEPIRAFLRLLPTAEGLLLDGDTAPTAYSNGAGEFVVGVPNPGTYQVWFRSADQAVPVALAEPVEFVDAESEVELHLPAGSVRGVVVDAEQRPVAGALVVARLAPAREQEVASNAIAGADGAFHLQSLQEGEWMLRAGAGETSDLLVSSEVRAFVAEDVEVTGLRLVLAPPAWLRVRVTTVEGLPIARASIWVREQGAGPEARSWERTLETNSAGEVEMAIPPGFSEGFALLVEAPGFQSAALQVSGEGGVVSAVLQPE